MKSQHEKQTIAIHILPNISRSKGKENLSVKKYNRRKFLLEK